MKKDETLKCKDCGAEFIFTVGEQEFYEEKGFPNKPTRCKACREERKRSNPGFRKPNDFRKPNNKVA